ncbi:hypothetical protein N7474_002103 [Penicillium riverlandense]|uniref:uncharacterized protein n=1 Tax=Penicillium riverlandense TaxID=1903569 RepID=UPI0025489E2B|nr:uncharacterized protein N7474_002103 [Penicillium riverlandense]KAJ5833792.1 hypothetical protein N7474_002103 [Penicillium riverlandense]
MGFITTFIAALACLPLAFTSPIEATNNTLQARQACTYGGTWEDFPPMSEWWAWGDIFNAYEQSMVNAGSSWDDVGRIAVAIEDAAAAIGVDERVILGIILQESSGYVGVPCTGGDDCGIMQCEGCPGYPGQNELSQHIKSNLEDFGNLDDPSSIYPALREYNSGSVDSGDLSVAAGGYGVPCYVSDVARRFMGEVF